MGYADGLKKKGKEMSKRETFKIVELAERRWRIEKFDALTGSFIAYQVMTKMLPSLMQLQNAKPEEQAAAMQAGLMSSSMSKAEFIAFQKDCLSVCKELQSAGGQELPVNVMMADGKFGVSDLDNDVMTVLALTIHALLFNITSFFEENALKSAMGSFQALSLFNAKT